MALNLNDIIKVGDYLRVEQKVVCYEAGEVAHIENVMIGETRERKNTYLEREEQITESESITENEQERDTQTSERYAMQRESQKITSQEMNFDVSLSLSGQAGPVKIEASTGFSLSQSTQQSDKTASDYAKSVVERARNRTFQRTRNYEKLTVIKQWEDINTHSFKNEPLPGEDKSNNIGIYRWVDKKYENKLMNYGKRLMLSLMIPDPAAWHRMAAAFTPSDGGLLVMPKAPAEYNIKTASDITDGTFLDIASKYNASVKPSPDEYISISKTYSNATSETIDNMLGTYEVKGTKPIETTASKDDAITVPDGYVLNKVACGIESYTRSNSGRVKVQVENLEFIGGWGQPRWSFQNEGWIDFKRTSIPISIFTVSFVDSYTVNVLIKLKRTQALYEAWQLDTYNAIMEAYSRQLSDYERQLNDLKDNANLQYGNNPTKNRLIEQQELKKGFINLLTEDSEYFTKFNVMYESYWKYPSIDTWKLTYGGGSPFEIDKPAEKVAFFEEAFDWDLMNYKFYPYYWEGQLYSYSDNDATIEQGRWAKVYSIRDNDDTFEKFLQAGYAHVVVPVRPDFELEVLSFLENGVMLNEDFVSRIPVVNTAKKEFLAIKLATNAVPPLELFPIEKKVWYTKAPTNLVILQTSAEGAPGVGLPCWE